MAYHKLNQKILPTRLNNNTGIASETMDTVCGNRILRTWRECKTKTIQWIGKQIPTKRLKRDNKTLSKPTEMEVFHGV
jgi:hypothetical protein